MACSGGCQARRTRGGVTAHPLLTYQAGERVAGSCTWSVQGARPLFWKDMPPRIFEALRAGGGAA